MIVISRIIGGLGNQLFQYASSLAFANSKNAQLYLDLSSFYNRKYYNPEGFLLAKLFNIKIREPGIHEYFKIFGLASFFFPIRSKFNFASLTNNYIHQENFLRIEKKFFSHKGKNCYLEGYWQSEEYFKNIKNIILKKFIFKHNQISCKCLNLAKELQSENSISIHVRRKDYITNKTYSALYNELSEKYYSLSVNYISMRIKKPRFYVFSDDIGWAKKQSYFKGFEFIDNSKVNSWNDLYLMSCCKNNIIANSSFSWWGAWLNNNPKKIVIAPKIWFRGSDQPNYIIPKNWIKI